MKDKELTLDENTHIYNFNGIKLESVTTYLKKFVPRFNVEKISKAVALKEGRTQEEVKREWQEKSLKSMNFGTKMHRVAEINANIKMGKDVKDFIPIEEREINFKTSIEQFWKYHPELKPVAVEKKICVPEWRLGGTVDLIVKCKEGKYYIVDWKSNERIDTFSRYNEKLLPPLQDLDNCHYVNYSLQLSLYAFMLEERYKLKIEGLYMIHLQEDGFTEYQCSYYKKEIGMLINKRVEELGDIKWV